MKTITMSFCSIITAVSLALIPSVIIGSKLEEQQKEIQELRYDVERLRSFMRDTEERRLTWGLWRD